MAARSRTREVEENEARAGNLALERKDEMSEKENEKRKKKRRRGTQVRPNFHERGRK